MGKQMNLAGYRLAFVFRIQGRIERIPTNESDDVKWFSAPAPSSPPFPAVALSPSGQNSARMPHLVGLIWALRKVPSETDKHINFPGHHLFPRCVQ